MGFLRSVIRGSYASADKEYKRGKKDVKKIKKLYFKNKKISSEQVSKSLKKDYSIYL